MENVNRDTVTKKRCSLFRISHTDSYTSSAKGLSHYNHKPQRPFFLFLEFYAVDKLNVLHICKMGGEGPGFQALPEPDGAKCEATLEEKLSEAAKDWTPFFKFWFCCCWCSSNPVQSKPEVRNLVKMNIWYNIECTLRNGIQLG